MAAELGPKTPDEKQIATSKKLKRRYIVLLVVLIIIIAGLVGGVLYLRYTQSAASQKKVEGTALVDQADQNGENGASDATKPTAVTTIPNLVKLMGLSADQAVASLGSQAKLISNSAVTDTNPDIVALAQVRIATKSAASTASTATTSSAATVTTTVSDPSVYLSLNSSGNTIEVYYSADLSQLGVAQKTFSDTIADTDAVKSYLVSAGLASSSVTVQAPDSAAIEKTYTKNKAGEQIVQTEKYTYSGTVADGGAVTHWSLALTFDHTVANASGDATDITRSLTIQFS